MHDGNLRTSRALPFITSPAVFRSVHALRIRLARRGNNRLSVLSIHALHNRDLLIAAGEKRAVLYFFDAITFGSYCSIIGIANRSVTLSTATPNTAVCPGFRLSAPARTVLAPPVRVSRRRSIRRRRVRTAPVLPRRRSRRRISRWPFRCSEPAPAVSGWRRYARRANSLSFFTAHSARTGIDRAQIRLRPIRQAHDVRRQKQSKISLS